jgi:hypothetical protein
MMKNTTAIAFILSGLLFCGWVTNAFVVTQSVSSTPFTARNGQAFQVYQRQTARNVATVDPATALSDVLGDLIKSPAVLAVPILAAVSVAAVIVGFIVSYSNPEDEDK